MLKRLLKRPSLNLLAWLLLAAFYISICLNIAFFKQVLQALPLDSLHNVLVFLSMPVVAFSVINIVLTLSSFLWLNRPLACLFILVGAAAQYFIMTYGIVIDRSMIANIIDTTPAESYALMTPQMLLTLGFSGVLACADCLLDKNQTCHLASAQCSFPWSQYSGFCTTDFAGRRTVL
ncbi:cell division protein [Escherichia coli]|uniref:Cell division protein n=1 Tax=Escherichia coli TaxID=562 RepID=A0A377DYR9_ECOLX|nr:cell division protein [Escherichia coli]